MESDDFRGEQSAEIQPPRNDNITSTTTTITITTNGSSTTLLAWENCGVQASQNLISVSGPSQSRS